MHMQPETQSSPHAPHVRNVSLAQLYAHAPCVVHAVAHFGSVAKSPVSTFTFVSAVPSVGIDVTAPLRKSVNWQTSSGTHSS